MKHLYRWLIPDHAFPTYVWPHGRSIGRYWVEEPRDWALWPVREARRPLPEGSVIS